MKFSELRFTKHLTLYPIMHSQWLKDSGGNLWRVTMSLQNLHYRLICTTPGIQQHSLSFTGMFRAPHNLTAADLQEAIQDLYPDE